MTTAVFRASSLVQNEVMAIIDHDKALCITEYSHTPERTLETSGKVNQKLTNNTEKGII